MLLGIEFTEEGEAEVFIGMMCDDLIVSLSVATIYWSADSWYQFTPEIFSACKDCNRINHEYGLTHILKISP